MLLRLETSKEGFPSANGLPREYNGQYLSFAGETLVELSPNKLVRDEEGMAGQSQLVETIVSAVETSWWQVQYSGDKQM